MIKACFAQFSLIVKSYSSDCWDADKIFNITNLDKNRMGLFPEFVGLVWFRMVC